MKNSWSKKDIEAKITELQADLANARQQVAIWSETAAGMHGHISGLQMMLKEESEKPSKGGKEDG